MANNFEFQDSVFSDNNAIDTSYAKKVTIVKDTTGISGTVKNSVGATKPKTLDYSLSKIDSLFRVLDKRNQEIAAKPKKENINEIAGNTGKDSLLLSLISTDSSYNNSYFLGAAGSSGNLNVKIYPGLFKENEVQNRVSKKENTELPFNVRYNNDLFLAILLVLVIFVIFIKTNFARFFNVLFQAPFNYQMSNKLFRDKNFLQNRFNMFLNFIYIVVVSIFIYQGLNFFDIRLNNSYLSFVYVLILITGIFIFRYIILSMLGNIFEAKKEFQEYQFNYFLYNRLAALIILPAVIIIPYVPVSLKSIIIYTMSGILVLAYVFKLLRGLNIIVTKHVLIFYVLLYLCTLEILPVLVGITYINKLI